jgi:hypothetical protein
MRHPEAPSRLRTEGGNQVAGLGHRAHRSEGRARVEPPGCQRAVLGCHPRRLITRGPESLLEVIEHQRFFVEVLLEDCITDIVPTIRTPTRDIGRRPGPIATRHGGPEEKPRWRSPRTECRRRDSLLGYRFSRLNPAAARLSRCPYPHPPKSFRAKQSVSRQAIVLSQQSNNSGGESSGSPNDPDHMAPTVQDGVHDRADRPFECGPSLVALDA